MSYKIADRDEAFNDGRFATASTSLLRIVGGWGNVSGPSIFMVRMIVTGSTTGVFFGMTAATFGALVFGTASLPFLIGSCSGFLLGSVAFYRSAMNQALLFLDRYPRLLQLHLDLNFPWKGFHQWRMDQLSSRVFSSNWTLKSMLIVGWLSAQPAIEQITEAREQALIEQASQQNHVEGTGVATEELTKADSFAPALREVSN